MNSDTPIIFLAEDNAADITLVREALKHHSIDCVSNVIQDGAQVMAYLDSLNNHAEPQPRQSSLRQSSGHSTGQPALRGMGHTFMPRSSGIRVKRKESPDA